MSKNILVPIDFQEPTLKALSYAVDIAEKEGHDLIVLHLIDSESERGEAESKINELINNTTTPDNVKLSGKVNIGKIEDDIGHAAEDLNSSFIVMGTHGAHGLSKIFGSKAIQVISESKTPYIVVQEDGKTDRLKKIAMTIDLEKESVQIVKAAIKLAKEFSCEIVLVGGDHTDPMLKSKVAVNVNTTRRILADNGIKSSVVLLERKDFLDNFIDYCKQNEVDVIAATYYADTFSVFSKKFVQKLLDNEAKIPVLTLDSDSITVSSQYSFMSV